MAQLYSAPPPAACYCRYADHDKSSVGSSRPTVNGRPRGNVKPSPRPNGAPISAAAAAKSQNDALCAVAAAAVAAKTKDNVLRAATAAAASAMTLNDALGWRDGGTEGRREIDIARPHKTLLFPSSLSLAAWLPRS